MKVCGIIAEFNPFHNGHAYIINQAKQEYGADFVIVVMSGDYVQRGEPAIMNKHIRCKHALLSGADLIIELPVVFATGSAEYFARGAVSILNSLGVVDFILFGSESGNLTQIADEIPTTPNDILGKAYLDALSYFNSSIYPVALSRIGTGYHDASNITDTEHGKICSATYLRKEMENAADSGNVFLSKQLFPQENIQSLTEYQSNYSWLDFSSLNTILFYKLNREITTGFTKYFDVYEDLSNKVISKIPDYIDASSFRMQLKSKDIAYSHISRALLHIVLDITKEELQTAISMDYCPYIRVLGFKKDASLLLHEIKQKALKSPITKLADSDISLSKEALAILNKDIERSHLYAHLSIKNNIAIPNEYRRPLVII